MDPPLSNQYQDEVEDEDEDHHMQTQLIGEKSGSLMMTDACEEASVTNSRSGLISCITSSSRGTHETMTNEVDNAENKKRRTVTFGDISGRVYERTAGFNPGVSSGAPLELDWNYRCTQDVSIEEYEAYYTRKRSYAELRIPKREREKILRWECGLSPNQIASHVRQTNRTKAHRLQTVNNLKFARVEEKLQKVKRAIGRALGTRKSYEKEVKKLWKKSAAVALDKSLGATQDTTSMSIDGMFSTMWIRPKMRCLKKGGNNDQQTQDLIEPNSTMNSYRKPDQYTSELKAHLNGHTSSSKTSELDQARHHKKFNLEEPTEEICSLDTEEVENNVDVDVDVSHKKTFHSTSPQCEEAAFYSPDPFEKTKTSELDQARHYKKYCLDESTVGIYSINTEEAEIDLNLGLNTAH